MFDRLLTLLVALVFVSQLGAYGLLEPDEGRYAEIGREMAAADGSWLIPTLNNVPHFQKPPLLYWLTALSLKVFGVSEPAARLPSALAALVTLLLTAGIARRLFPGPWAARCALLILASSPLFLFLGRTLTPDMLMTAWITAAIYCLVRRNCGGGHAWGWAFFVCIGLGFLSKGPVALLVPIAAAIAWRCALPAGTLRMPWLPGLALALLIGLSWFIVLSMQYPALFDYFWKYELVERIGSSHHGRSRPVWFFVPILIAGFLPWSLPALGLLKSAWRQRAGGKFGLFFGWLLVPFVVLSLSGSKLPTYVLPLFPGMAVALGAGMASWAQNERLPSRALGVTMLVFLLIVGAIPIGVSLFGPASTGGEISWMAGAALCVGVAAAIGGLVFFRRSKNVGEMVVGYSAAVLVLWAFYPSQISGWNDLLAQQACVRSLAEAIQDECPPGQPRRVIACEVRAHGLEFALGETVETTVSEADIVLPAGLLDAGLPELHKRPKDVAKLLARGDHGIPIYVLTRTGRFEKDFAERGWTVVRTAGDFVLLRR